MSDISRLYLDKSLINISRVINLIKTMKTREYLETEVVEVIEEEEGLAEEVLMTLMLKKVVKEKETLVKDSKIKDITKMTNFKS
jgi:hypothetical protein